MWRTQPCGVPPIFLHVEAHLTDQTERSGTAIMERNLALRGVTKDAIVKVARSLPFGYIGAEG